ncbi:hypothetical protein RRG08_007511 [Elysia crispata]|uniref:Uncharacterized protein n=1 Tax=Elysia crispata TaxID=231223 RepID=A0AAE1AT41_9GAST|nr:hypothetical protein RRG08_007511 [Elysia crispata]
MRTGVCYFAVSRWRESSDRAKCPPQNQGQSSTEQRRATTRNWCLILVISYMVREFHRAKAPHHKKLVFDSCHIVLVRELREFHRAKAPHYKKLVFNTCHIVQENSTEQRRPTTRNWCLILVISYMVREFRRAKAPHNKKLVFDTCHIVHGERVPQSKGAPLQETGV